MSLLAVWSGGGTKSSLSTSISKHFVGFTPAGCCCGSGGWLVVAGCWLFVVVAVAGSGAAGGAGGARVHASHRPR